jgi:hypothetical protein
MERVKTQYPDRSRSSQFDNEVRPDLTKLLPFRIAADKERLYAELLDVKRKLVLVIQASTTRSKTKI